MGNANFDMIKVNNKDIDINPSNNVNSLDELKNFVKNNRKDTWTEIFYITDGDYQGIIGVEEDNSISLTCYKVNEIDDEGETIYEEYDLIGYIEMDKFTSTNAFVNTAAFMMDKFVARDKFKEELRDKYPQLNYDVNSLDKICDLNEAINSLNEKLKKIDFIDDIKNLEEMNIKNFKLVSQPYLNAIVKYTGDNSLNDSFEEQLKHNLEVAQLDDAMKDLIFLDREYRLLTSVVSQNNNVYKCIYDTKNIEDSLNNPTLDERFIDCLHISKDSYDILLEHDITSIGKLKDTLGDYYLEYEEDYYTDRLKGVSNDKRLINDIKNALCLDEINHNYLQYKKINSKKPLSFDEEIYYQKEFDKALENGTLKFDFLEANNYFNDGLSIEAKELANDILKGLKAINQKQEWNHKIDKGQIGKQVQTLIDGFRKYDNSNIVAKYNKKDMFKDICENGNSSLDLEMLKLMNKFLPEVEEGSASKLNLYHLGQIVKENLTTLYQENLSNENTINLLNAKRLFEIESDKSKKIAVAVKYSDKVVHDIFVGKDAINNHFIEIINNPNDMSKNRVVIDGFQLPYSHYLDVFSNVKFDTSKIYASNFGKISISNYVDYLTDSNASKEMKMMVCEDLSKLGVFKFTNDSYHFSVNIDKDKANRLYRENNGRIVYEDMHKDIIKLKEEQQRAAQEKYKAETLEEFMKKIEHEGSNASKEVNPQEQD